MQQPLAFIPSPSNGVWHLWFIPIRGYALMIILGVIVAVWLTERRWVARGGQSGVAVDVAVWAVPFGLIGGRIYHVLTDWELYFGEGGRALDAFMIWKGGLGIWGAISLGAVGAYFGCRQRGASLRAFADAAAPGIVLAQGIGRWGNWFNQELFGSPTSLPWALEIDPGRPGTIPGELTYHPTFLYEFLWCLGVAALLLWAERRYSLGYGRTFALYVAAYTVGRFWIELLRIDPAHEIMGLRLNNWTSIVVFLGAVSYLYLYRGRATTWVEAAPVAVGVAAGATGTTVAAGAGAVGAGADDDSDDILDAEEIDEPAEEQSEVTGWDSAQSAEAGTAYDAEAEPAVEESYDDYDSGQAYETDEPYESASTYDDGGGQTYDSESAYDSGQTYEDGQTYDAEAAAYSGTESYAAEEPYDAGQTYDADDSDADEDAGATEAPVDGELTEVGDAEFVADEEDAASYSGYDADVADPDDEVDVADEEDADSSSPHRREPSSDVS